MIGIPYQLYSAVAEVSKYLMKDIIKLVNDIAFIAVKTPIPSTTSFEKQKLYRHINIHLASQTAKTSAVA